MLILTRKKGEKIIINDEITITVIERRCGKLQLGIDAPPDVNIYRAELAKPQKTKSPDLAAASKLVPMRGLEPPTY